MAAHSSIYGSFYGKRMNFIALDLFCCLHSQWFVCVYIHTLLQYLQTFRTKLLVQPQSHFHNSSYTSRWMKKHLWYQIPNLATVCATQLNPTSLIPVQHFLVCYVFTTHLFHELDRVLQFSVKNVALLAIFFFTQQGVNWEKLSTASSGYASRPHQHTETYSFGPAQKTSWSPPMWLHETLFSYRE